MPVPYQRFNNLAFLSDPEEKSRAEGWNKPKSGPATRNGGLKIEKICGYAEDTMLVRFDQIRRKDQREPHPSVRLAAGWWLTEDMFSWLLSRVFGATGQPSQNIEAQMLLPPDWNQADCVVRAYPKKGVILGGWFGRPRTVLAVPGGARRVMQGGGAQQTEDWMYQIYIPGLYRRPMNVQNWLEFEGIYSTKLAPGPVLSQYPRLRKGKPHR